MLHCCIVDQCFSGNHWSWTRIRLLAASTLPRLAMPRFVLASRASQQARMFGFFVQPFHLQLVFEASALFFVIADLCNALVSDCDNILCSPPFKPPECFAIISVVCQLLVSVRWSRCTSTALNGSVLILHMDGPDVWSCSELSNLDLLRFYTIYENAIARPPQVNAKRMIFKL